MTNVICTSNSVYLDLPERLTRRLGVPFELITEPADLTSERLAAIGPRYVFLPHWSHIIPPDVFEPYECVVFHMTDLPFGRGGSPLQNLIVRGITDTRISALRCVRELDAGPIYLKRPLCLAGSAEEIFLRAAGVIEEMIAEIVAEEPEPRPQEGEPVLFKRRTPADGDLAGLSELGEVFDHIRMLDAEGYPRAFVEVGGLRFEFERAALRRGSVKADVTITRVEDERS